MLAKQWFLKSQENARYYDQSKTRTGWTVFVEAPTASGRIYFTPGCKMDLWRWAPIPSALPNSSGSSTSDSVSSDRQQLAVTYGTVYGRIWKDILIISPIRPDRVYRLSATLDLQYGTVY